MSDPTSNPSTRKTTNHIFLVSFNPWTRYVIVNVWMITRGVLPWDIDYTNHDFKICLIRLKKFDFKNNNDKFLCLIIDLGTKLA